MIEYSQATETIAIKTLRGADVRVSATFDIDLTGRTATVFEVSPVLSGLVTSEISDAENGVVSIFIEGSNPIPIGRHGFRVLTDGDNLDSIPLPQFLLEVR
jgi:hypothetical protein